MISASTYSAFLLAPIISAELQILLIIHGIPFEALAIASYAFGLNTSIVHFAPDSLAFM